MWNAFQSGQEGVARTLYMRTLPLLVIQTIYRMRLTKHVLTTRGVLDNANVRAPLMKFDAYDQAEVALQLDSISDLLGAAPTTIAVE